MEGFYREKYYGIANLEGWRIDGKIYLHKVPDSVLDKCTEVQLVSNDIGISNRLYQANGVSMLHLPIPYKINGHYISNSLKVTSYVIDFIKKYPIGCKVIFLANVPDYEAIKRQENTGLGIVELIES